VSLSHILRFSLIQSPMRQESILSMSSDVSCLLMLSCPIQQQTFLRE
jgi:hypothetical protein